MNVLRGRSIRTRLLVVVVVALAVALTTATFGFNALLARTASRTANSFLRQRADTERALVRVHDGRIDLADETGDNLADSGIWIFRGAALVQGPHGAGPTAVAARSLTTGGARFLDVQPTDTRLYALPLRGGGRHVGTIVVGTSLAPYEETRRLALVASSAFALALLALVSGAIWWLLRSALRPVTQMTEQAAAWSEHDLDRRFDLGEPHDELMQLAATLDGLLDRIAASLRHERRFSAEISHELRTPLAKVLGESELALRRERTPAEYRTALELVNAGARQIARIVDTLVAAAEHEASPTAGTADAFQVACDAIATVATPAAVEISAGRPSRPARIGVDADLAACVLQPVLENGCRYARSRVAVTVTREGSRVLYTVTDDGPGVAADEQEAIFAPGARGSASDGTRGAGLGLALARRLARAATGDVTAVARGDGGCFVVALPAA
jgi:signal transduction histidine kinase